MKTMEKYQKLYRVLNFVVYTFMDNYICIDYLLCQSKNLFFISCNPTFEDIIFNILLGIDIAVLLLNIVSCHELTKNTISNVILNWLTCLIKNCLSKWLSVIEQNTKQLNFLPNDTKMRINMINQLDTYYVTVKNKAFYAVENTIKE